MSSKNKKPSTVPFNKKNVLAFADTIFSDKDGVISCLKLCEGDLSNGKDGKRTLHCAIGEAYYTFINSDMRKVLNIKGEKDNYGGYHDYSSKWSQDQNGSTGAAIDALVEAAQLKKMTRDAKEELAAALDRAVDKNDDGEEEHSSEVFFERARKVANVFRNSVAPLLK